ncbi:hypothetical protein LR004_01945 [Candidatus Gracilibacteria bacterium]|nr:hypothetical protein [Candidatus Gracilibacteria bacterium]
MAPIISNTEVVQSFNKVLKNLSEKEQTVMTKRLGVYGDKETLQHIGNSFEKPITRERVRQIENSGIKKIGRVLKSTILGQIQEKALELINLHGGLMLRDKIISTIINELKLDKDVNASIIEIVIQSDFEISKSKPKIGTHTYFYKQKISPQLVNAVHSEALKILRRKKDVMEKTDLYTQIQNRFAPRLKIEIPFIDSCLDIFEDLVKGEETLIGLTRWKILNPKTLKDKTVFVMKKEKIPMHFVDISNKITEYLGEQVKVNTIHNELIRNPDFVLIGRGIYALKAWGFKPGTVLDVIIQVLEKNGAPMNTDEIANKVLKIRNVKKTTIYMNLQNKDVIERVGRNYYQLKAA